SALIGLAVGLAVVFVHTLDGARAVEAWNREYVTRYASQLDSQFWRLLEASTRYANGDPEVDSAAIGQRLDVLASLIALFDSGLGRNHLQQVPGGPETIAALKRNLAVNEPRLRALAPNDPAGLAPIRAQMAPLGRDLTTLAAKLQLFETEGEIAAVQKLKNYFIL